MSMRTKFSEGAFFVQIGDILAYRLVELTHSWTPEISPYRVSWSAQVQTSTLVYITFLYIYVYSGYDFVSKQYDVMQLPFACFLNLLSCGETPY